MNLGKAPGLGGQRIENMQAGREGDHLVHSTHHPLAFCTVLQQRPNACVTAHSLSAYTPTMSGFQDLSRAPSPPAASDGASWISRRGEVTRRAPRWSDGRERSNAVISHSCTATTQHIAKVASFPGVLLIQNVFPAESLGTRLLNSMLNGSQ